jgi:hypothetical protein
MSTITTHTAESGYHPSLTSSTMEQSSLPMELAGRTSSSETDKFNRSNYWQAPVLRSGNKESYIAFCGDILHFNDEDEEDQIARNALEAALYTTERAYTRLPNKWRNPRIATDGGGGVRLTWRLGEKEIRAVFPASMRRPQYLYVEGGDVPYTIPNFTSTTLCDKFEWLLLNK